MRHSSEKRAEAGATAPTLNHHRLAGRININPTRMELTMDSNITERSDRATFLEQSPYTMANAETKKLDLIWGCAAIAATLGITERACFHMLEGGVLPARKVGARWVASRRKLEQHFEETAA